MNRHYTTPVLLIEFQRDAAFVLHAPSDISDDIQVSSPALQLVFCALAVETRLGQGMRRQDT